MEKLELKHIAPYLPYGLKVQWTDHNHTCQRTIIGAGKNHVTFDAYLDEEDQLSITILYYDSSKPILRPLSDLTKEIEVDGEKFVPAIELNWSNITSDILSKSIDLTNKFNNLFAFDYKKLCEWHFDVFGLIEKGLAIDINSLNDFEELSKTF